MSIKIGQMAEHRARLFLEQQGLQFISKNYHCRLGEIDLIMKEKATWVFVEVRYRCNALFGDSVDTITWQKQRKLRQTAEVYFKRKQLESNTPARFDVVAITGQQIRWIPNALGDL